MIARTNIVSKDDIVFVARSKGWTGTRKGMPKAKLLEWLAARGVQQHDIPGLLRAARQGADTGIAGQQAAPAIDKASIEAMVEELIADAMAGIAAPREITIKAPNEKPVTLKKHTHPVFETVLKLVNAGLNVLLVGPAGCGKTTLAEHIAEATKRKYGTLHCTSGASESQLTGWLLPVGANGRFDYVPSEFVALFEDGDSLFLLDEIDAADPNMLLVINAALANGSLHVPSRFKNPHVKRGKRVAIIAAANTYGTGADMMYAGRNQLDAATLDRFIVVKMDYDPAYEQQVIGTDEEDRAIGNWVLKVRNVVQQNRMRRVVSTRTIQKAIASRRAGIAAADIKAMLLAGWTADELQRVQHLN